MAEARSELDTWLDWMDLEVDNVRSILRQCLNPSGYSRGLDFAASLGWYWATRATTEGVHWLDALLALEPLDSEAHPQAYFVRGFLAVLQGDAAAARAALRRAVMAARADRNVVLRAHSLSMASVAANMDGDRGAAKRFLAGADALTRGTDDVPARVSALQARALNGLFEGDLEAVRTASSEGARLSREARDLYRLEMMVINLGCADLMAGDLEAARPRFAEGLRLARLIDDRVAQFYGLEALACHAARSGQARRAAQLLGAEQGVRTGAGAGVIPMLAPLLAEARDSAMAALGPARFEAEFQVGQRMDRDAAIGMALGEPAKVAAATIDDVGRGLLGRREAEVAQLVAEGMSNKQIGARLFISEHTVDSHIRNVLNKLGVSSRSQIAAWVGSSRD